jgi:hypothetical protein
MFGKYNGFVSKARVSACMYFLVKYINPHFLRQFTSKDLLHAWLNVLKIGIVNSQISAIISAN